MIQSDPFFFSYIFDDNLSINSKNDINNYDPQSSLSDIYELENPVIKEIDNKIIKNKLIFKVEFINKKRGR